MQSVKDIKARIKSVSETAKITRAMELISASKMQKFSVRYNNSQEYFLRVREIIADIINNTEFDENEIHPYLVEGRKGKKAYIVIGSDRGLSGEYNHDISAYAQKVIGDQDCVVYCIGDILCRLFAEKKQSVKKIVCEEGTLEDARIIATHLAESYKNEEINEIQVIYTHLVTKSRQECATIRLLPLVKEDFPLEENGDYKRSLDFEPDARKAFAMIVPQYLVGIIYGCLTEAKYAEHLERMRAMNSATESAEELLEELQLNYNKARQEKITTELTELSVSLLESE